MDYFQFILLGIGAGAVYAALALGLVLTHLASGVVNFAHGAIAMYAAYVFTSLATNGSYPLPPLPAVPAFIEFGSEGLPLGIALVGALATAAGIGFLFHLFVFRLLRYQPPLAKVVASIGLMLILQAAIVIRFGSTGQTVPNLLPTDAVQFLGVSVPADRLILLGIILVLTGVLSLVYKRTRFGLHTHAGAENERNATLLGISVDRIAAFNWMIAAFLAGLVGVLVAPITGLTPTNFTLFIIPALAGAVVGGFRSFWIAVFAALAIGMGQSLLQIMELRMEWLPDINLREGLPLLVIVLAMALRGRVLPTQDRLERGRLPYAYPSHFRPLFTSVWVVGLAIALVWLPFEFRAGLINTLIGTVLAISLVVVTGFVGQISLAQMSLAGIAAFGLSTFTMDWGIPFPFAPLLAALVATGFGILVGIPALRVRGASLAIITLAAAGAIEVFLFKSTGWFSGEPFREVSEPSIFGIAFGPDSSFFIDDGKVPTPSYGLFVLMVTTAVMLAVVRLRQSRLGEQMLAVRANELAAAGVGINVAGVKLAGFAISSFLAGLGGTLVAYSLSTYGVAKFGIFESITLLAFAYLGGISTVAGAAYAGTFAAGGIGTVIVEQWVDNVGSYEAYVAGIGLVITVIFNPIGVDGFDREQRKRFVRWWRTRARPALGLGDRPSHASEG